MLISPHGGKKELSFIFEENNSPTKSKTVKGYGI